MLPGSPRQGDREASLAEVRHGQIEDSSPVRVCGYLYLEFESSALFESIAERPPAGAWARGLPILPIGFFPGPRLQERCDGKLICGEGIFRKGEPAKFINASDRIQGISFAGEPATRAPLGDVVEDPTPDKAADTAARESAGQLQYDGCDDRLVDASAAELDVSTVAACARAVNVQACKRDGDPAGARTVTITLCPAGTVGKSVIADGVFPGTRVGGCIAGRFRSLRFPSFRGPPRTMTIPIEVR